MSGGANRRVEVLWFGDCPHHAAARRLLQKVIDEVAPGTRVADIDAGDPRVADAVRFPGSPTIRVDGRDVDPHYTDPGDYTPRCRLYWTDRGPRGLPERRWVEEALRSPATAPGARRRRLTDTRTDQTAMKTQATAPPHHRSSSPLQSR